LPNLGAAFGSPIGQPAEISAHVVCIVRLSSILVPGLPGSIRLTSNFSSPLDPYRSRDLAAPTWSQVTVTALSRPDPDTGRLGPLRREEPDETTAMRRAG
jgi:hypothetical protein